VPSTGLLFIRKPTVPGMATTCAWIRTLASARKIPHSG